MINSTNRFSDKPSWIWTVPKTKTSRSVNDKSRTFELVPVPLYVGLHVRQTTDLARFVNYVDIFAMTMPPTLNGGVSLVNRTDAYIPIVLNRQVCDRRRRAEWYDACSS
jgi:hypothetical protein